VLWTSLGVFCAAVSGRFPARRIRFLLAAIVLFAFVLFAFAGLEVMEMRTGAWWRPLGLMVWKAACIVALIILAVDHFRWRKTKPGSDNNDRAKIH